MPEELKDWLPFLGVVLVAVIAAAASAGGVLLTTWGARRTAREKNAADATQGEAERVIRIGLARLETDKVELSARQLQVQREEMVAEVTERMGALYNRLLTDANASLDRLQTGLAECTARDEAKGVRLDRIEAEARKKGWELP